MWLLLKDHRYNKLCGSLRSFAHRISLLPPQDPFRSRMESQLLSKLYDMGVLNSTAKLSDVDNKLTVAAFCRRRLAVFMCMSKMSETVSAVRTSDFIPPPVTNYFIGSQIHWTGSCTRRARYHYRSGLSCNPVRFLRFGVCPFVLMIAQTYGGLCNMGRYLETQAHYHAVQRRGQ